MLGDSLELAGRQALKLSDLDNGSTGAAEVAHQRTGPDTVVKFLLTSGSAGRPKPVITTNRMLCSNQVMLREALPFVTGQPPVLVDWLPWNHTFGGSHNVGLVLFNGGTLYIDDGKPTPKAFAETLRNLREISPTIYFNVPKGFEMLAPHLQQDQALRESFYRRLRTCFFSGAGLLQHVWDALDGAARAAGPRRIPVPFRVRRDRDRTGRHLHDSRGGPGRHHGRPAAGNVLKLAPVEGEARTARPRPQPHSRVLAQPERDAAAFDEEGYYCSAMRSGFSTPQHPARGLIFDGRLTEDFKLASGTWVSVGPVRSALLAALAPLAQDVVIAGLDRDFWRC